MFTTEIEGKKLRFWFQHHSHVYKKGRQRTVELHITDVSDDPMGGKRIEDLPKLYTATSITHPKDQFVKEKGRRVALTRALTAMWPNDKAIRTQIWTKYLRR